MYERPTETHPDPARPGRVRRLLVTVVPPALALLASVAVIYVHLAYGAPEFERWSSGRYLTPVLLTWVMVLGMFLYYWRWPELQRWAAVASCALTGMFVVMPVLELVQRLNSSGPVPEQSWPLLAGWLVLPVGGLLGWLLVGRLPSPPAATAAPHPSAPSLPLASGQKAMFTTARWSLANVAAGIAMLAAGIVWLGRDPLSIGFVFLCLGVFTIAQAHARLHIDGGGVVLVLAGRLRLPLSYEHVRQAHVLPKSPPSRRFAPGGSAYGWGFATGSGPALVLELTDGRRFVYSTRDAETAAELVNGFLTRERANADHG